MPHAPRPVAAHLVHALGQASRRASAGLGQGDTEDGLERLQARAAREIDAAHQTSAIPGKPGIAAEGAAWRQVELGSTDRGLRAPGRIDATGRLTGIRQGPEEVVDLGHAGVERGPQLGDEGLVVIVHVVVLRWICDEGVRGSGSARMTVLPRGVVTRVGWPIGNGVRGRSASFRVIDEAQDEEREVDRADADRP